ncbi:MAG: hypothetical protein AB7I52_17470 [Rhizobiaceae bacterium]
MADRFDFPNLSDAELDAEFRLWNAATVGSRVPAWIDTADRYRNAITAERTRRRQSVDPYRKAAEAKGWRHGGDGDGFIYDSNVFDSWKEAVSWSGDDGRDERERSSTIYATWRECCEAEDIEVAA